MGWERSLKNDEEQLCNVFTFLTFKIEGEDAQKKKKKGEEEEEERLKEKQTVVHALAHRPKEENIKYY